MCTMLEVRINMYTIKRLQLLHDCIRLVHGGRRAVQQIWYAGLLGWLRHAICLLQARLWLGVRVQVLLRGLPYCEGASSEGYVSRLAAGANVLFCLGAL